MRILVVGGAGYIGSHMVRYLMDREHEVSVFDNLSTGHRDAVGDAEFVEGDLANAEQIDEVLRSAAFDGVMHFASSIQVGESVSDPAKYYRNNVTNTQNLMDAMVATQTNYFVFSSTAAIGNPICPDGRGAPKAPINPYGRIKLMVEQMLDDYDRAYGEVRASAVLQRCGRTPGGVGERHEPETYLSR